MITLYIIPGFGEKTEDQGYKDIVKLGNEKGYKVVKVNPVWERNTINKWLSDFNEMVDKDKNQQAIVIGFSFGAYIAALSSINHHFKKIIFCSLSPYFKEDIPKLPELAYKMLGKRRIKDFSTHEFPQSINIPAIFLVGDKDIPLVIKRVEKSYKNWTGQKKIQILPNVHHDINHTAYLKAIEKYL